MKVAASAAPPTAMSLPSCALSRAISSAGSSRASRALPWTASSVVENTTFGVAVQMRANSRATSGASGSSPRVCHGRIVS